MPNIKIECKNCGSSHIVVRSSHKITTNTVASVMYCQSCHTQHVVHSEVVRIKIPIFHDCPEALRHDKPFKEVDPNQLEIDTE